VPTLNTAPPTDSVHVIIPGDLTSTSFDQAKLSVFQAMADADARRDPWRTLRIDLGNARMVDSVGLNLLVHVIKHVEQHGHHLEIVISHPSVARAIAFTRLDTKLTVIRRA
jgi:anti-anti-sigma factor